MVIDMMEVHVQRLKKTRPKYTHSPEAMADFAQYFPHKPTPDQEAVSKEGKGEWGFFLFFFEGEVGGGWVEAVLSFLAMWGV